MTLFQFLIPAIEIGIISCVIYYLLSFFWNTRGMDLVLGIMVFGSVYFMASFFSLPVLQKLMWYFVNASVIGMIVIFQPEIRLALSKLSFKGLKYQELSEFDHFLETLAQVVYRFSEKRIGALIILENKVALDEFANKAVRLDAAFSPELIEAIFSTASPLHDGGVIIRNNTIISAATILPLADDTHQISKSMGTRHRAGLGLTQVTDALVIVVSEETGKVAIARDGIITRGVRPDRFRGVIRSIFTPPKSAVETGLDLLGWIKKWKRAT